MVINFIAISLCLAYLRYPWIAKTFFPLALLSSALISFLPGAGISTRELAMKEAQQVVLYIVFLSVDIVPTMAMTVAHLSFMLFFTHTLVYHNNTNSG